MSASTTTPYLERLKAGLRQARPKQMDDIWISSTHLSSSRRVVMAERTEMDWSLAHLFAENLNWWCRDDEMLELLRDKTRLQRLVNVTVESAIWLGQHHTTIGEASTSAPSSFGPSCVGCSLPFESNSSISSGSSSSSQGRRSKNSASQDDGGTAKPSMDAEETEHRLHLLIISMAVICGLLRHAPPDSSDLADRLVVMLSIDTPSIMPLLEEEEQAILPWVEEQMREGRPQATPPLMELLGRDSSSSNKAAVGAAGLLSLVLCHRPAVVLNSLQEDVTLGSLNRYLQNVCFPLLVQQKSKSNSSSSSNSSKSPCLVQERFGLVAFMNILPTLYYLGSWKRMARRHAQMKSLVARLVTILLNLCHSATLDTIPSTMAKPNGTSAVAAANYRTNDGPADLEHLPELINAKFVVLESLLLHQAPSLSPTSVSLQNPSSVASAQNNNNWRMEALQQRPTTCAVAAGLEVLAWWSRHGIDLFDIDLDDVEELDMASMIPKESTAATDTTDGGLRPDEDISSRTTTIADCFTEYLPRVQILAQRVPRLGYMETIARALSQGVKPPASGAAMAMAMEVSSAMETTTATCGVTTAFFLEEPFSLARDRCGLPSCRRRRAATAQSQQQDDPSAVGSKKSSGSIGTGSSTTSKHLKVCNGGCKGLERYCSRDHQKEHWPIHKMFCKSNKSSSSLSY